MIESASHYTWIPTETSRTWMSREQYRRQPGLMSEPTCVVWFSGTKVYGKGPPDHEFRPFPTMRAAKHWYNLHKSTHDAERELDRLEAAAGLLPVA